MSLLLGGRSLRSARTTEAADTAKSKTCDMTDYLSLFLYTGKQDGRVSCGASTLVYGGWPSQNIHSTTEGSASGVIPVRNQGCGALIPMNFQLATPHRAKTCISWFDCGCDSRADFPGCPTAAGVMLFSHQSNRHTLDAAFFTSIKCSSVSGVCLT